MQSTTVPGIPIIFTSGTANIVPIAPPPLLSVPNLYDSEINFDISCFILIFCSEI